MKEQGQPQIAALVVEHATFVFRVLTHLGVPSSHVEDASQEVFLIVLRQLDGFEGRSSVQTWLFGICRNVARSFRRRERGKLEVSTEELPESVVQPAQEGEVWIRRAHQLLLQALEVLDEEQRAVFVLFEVEQFTMDQIAASLNCPTSTCYARLYAARSKVQAQLRRREALGTNKAGR
jgi:RNA polymerase sigma-70 factor (ECF subfamily)